VLSRDENFQISEHQSHISFNQPVSCEILSNFHIENINNLNWKW